MGYEIEPIKLSSDVIYRAKNDCGQIIELKFLCDEFDNCTYWCVSMWIGKRKRGYEYLNQTGRDGLKSLIWAKKCIIDFMENGPRNYGKNHILIAWDDNRRKRSYIRGLSDIGFSMKRIEHGMWLHREI